MVTSGSGVLDLRRRSHDGNKVAVVTNVAAIDVDLEARLEAIAEQRR
jgi:hypothetical protein